MGAGDLRDFFTVKINDGVITDPANIDGDGLLFIFFRHVDPFAKPYDTLKVFIPVGDGNGFPVGIIIIQFCNTEFEPLKRMMDDIVLLFLPLVVGFHILFPVDRIVFKFDHAVAVCRKGFKHFSAGPGFCRRSTPTAIDQSHRHLQVFENFSPEKIGHC